MSPGRMNRGVTLVRWKQVVEYYCEWATPFYLQGSGEASRESRDSSENVSVI